MMKICYMMTLAVVLCTSGTIGATGIKSVYAAENEVQGRAATTNGILNLNNGPASITIKGNDGQSLKGKRFWYISYFRQKMRKEWNPLITRLIRNTRNLSVISWDSGFIRMREM